MNKSIVNSYHVNWTVDIRYAYINIKLNRQMKYINLIQWICSWILFFTCLTITSSYAQSVSSETIKSDTSEMVSWWSFDAEKGHSVYDNIQQKKDSIYGSFEYVPGIDGSAIKLDGFRTYIKRDQNNLTGWRKIL